MASVKILMFSLFISVLNLILLAVVCASKSYLPQGRMIEPPPRLSLWRYGYNTPQYNQDNTLSCIRKDKPRECGLCGETAVVAKNLQTAKSAENTVKIVRTYARGQNIKVGVLLITPTVRSGLFRFELCPKCTFYEQETEACFRKYTLKVVSLSRIDPSQPIETRLAAASDNILTEEELVSEQIDEREHGKGLYSIPNGLPPDTVLVIALQLPSDAFCDACVIRWKYFAGKHQRIYGCADVRITASTTDQGKGPQWVDERCAPENVAPEIIVVHRRAEAQTIANSPAQAVSDSITGNPALFLVKSSNKRRGVRRFETNERLNSDYPGIYSKLDDMYPYIYRHKLEASNANLTDSMAPQGETTSKFSLAVRNLTLPLSFYFFLSFFSLIVFPGH